MSALLVEVSEVAPLVDDWRRAHDPAFARGIPPHVTVLFPFLDPRTLTDADLAAARDVIAATPSFDFALARVDTFSGVLWLRPEPDEPFRALTNALWGAYPACPPYGGAFPDSRPHLTVAHTHDDDAFQRLHAGIESALGQALPISVRATAVTLMTSNADDHWTRRATFPLAAATTAQPQRQP